MPGWLRRVITVVAARLPRPLARRCVRSIGGVAWLGPGSTTHRRTARIIERALGESPREARRISREHFRRLCQLHADYAYFATRAPERVLPLADEMDVVGPGLARIADRRPDALPPVLLATIHMGGYLRGLLKLVRAAPALRRIHLVKLQEATRQEERAYRHFATAGVCLNVIRLSDRPGLRVLRALRAGDTVVLLFDSPPSFGPRRSAVVHFLGRQARFPAGPALLALAGRAVILPAVSHADACGREILRLEAPIAARALAGEDRARAAARLTQALADRAERWIRRSPCDWLLWQALPEFWEGASPGTVPPPRT